MSDWVGIFIILVSLFYGGVALGIKCGEPMLDSSKALSSAQTDLITKMQNGIKATVADDPYSCGMRNGIRWCMSLIDDKEPLYENCPHCGARMDGE